MKTLCGIPGSASSTPHHPFFDPPPSIVSPAGDTTDRKRTARPSESDQSGSLVSPLLSRSFFLLVSTLARTPGVTQQKVGTLIIDIVL